MTSTPIRTSKRILEKKTSPTSVNSLGDDATGLSDQLMHLIDVKSKKKDGDFTVSFYFENSTPELRRRVSMINTFLSVKTKRYNYTTADAITNELDVRLQGFSEDGSAQHPFIDIYKSAKAFGILCHHLHDIQSNYPNQHVFVGIDYSQFHPVF